MPATALCLLTALGSPLLVGVPVRRLLRRGRPLNERAWLEAPFVGLATLILVLQNLVYLGVPLRRSVPWFWLAVGLLWLALWWRRGLRGSWRHCPAGVLAVCVGVYLLQGLGLLLLGAPRYLGNYMSDQLNYITVAEYLADHPLSTPAEAIGPRPHLLHALVFRDDRIGQSVLHGCLALSAGQEAAALYEATSLLGPALLVIPFYWLAGHFGLARRGALLVGATAGLLPGVTQLHLEGFLSQTLALPFLFALLVTFRRALAGASVERALVAMLLSACAVSVYTEFALILAGLMLVLLVGGLATYPWKSAGLSALAVLLAPALLNPLSLPHQLPALGRLSASLFPRYFRTRLPALPELVWFGEEFRRIGVRHGMRAAGVVLTVPAVVGLLALGLRQWRLGRRRPGFVLALGVLALACLPVLALLRRPLNPYPVYKLTLTGGPLLALGLCLLLPRARPALLLLAATGTALMEHATIGQHRTPYAHIRSLMSEDYRWAEGQLTALGPGEVVLAVEPEHHANWLSYRARHHRMWLLPAPGAGAPQPEPPPAASPVYLLVEDSVWSINAGPGRGDLLARRGRFSLWRWHGALSLAAAARSP